ncbi:Efflux pump himE-like protein [Cladobotryum mycophilum]|uniref:Efflux pump himE-like protein n=1 Tax=Cladobotryum mycophilum TaxID=491253 RepID=A0ABR0SSL8_9HYPO
MVTHIYIGLRWKSQWFMPSVVVGCLIEIAGYAGRIVLYHNPWSFVGFMVQIVLITTGPVFYTASIYVTLSMMINIVGPELSRFPSKLFYWGFIPIDIICLIFQAVGGALSASTAGSSKTSVYVALTGLGLQVFALLIFCVLFSDYLFRYIRARSMKGVGRRMILFLSFLSIAIALILGRCAYRCHELSQGYRNSKVITNEGLFISLEGA